MKCFLLLSLLFLSTVSFGQPKEEAAVRAVLDRQVAAWNRGDIPAFMQGYWKSDSLMFIGKSGIKWGWQKTLEGYQKGYPDTATMGKLSFELLLVKQLAPNYFFVVGKWHLKRSIGDVGGHYDLLFRKVKGRWVIVSDHTS